ncbi:MAG: cobalamin biosynthesis protein [Chloroflexi bacterium]|nr:cobalamin biosynthesis protein [Chloroflexota bacterium]
MEVLLILFLAIVLDLALGEPPNPINPVAWMGKIASFLEKFSPARCPPVQFVYGMGMTLLLIGLFSAVAYFVLLYLRNLSLVAYVIAGAVLLKSTFSLRGLGQAAIRIKKLLLRDKLDEARFELRSLVSRDTGDLSQPLLISATVESVAENSCDSFVAPLFYFLLFGIPGAVAYRVVNTLDAMIGYHGKYEYSGKFAARLDDVLNFIPARLAALCLILASFLSGKGVRASRVAFSDHARTASPNAGWTMAAIAGALDVQLEKVGHYRLGVANAPLTIGSIDAALKLVMIAMLTWSLVCFIAGVFRFAVTT